MAQRIGVFKWRSRGALWAWLVLGSHKKPSPIWYNSIVVGVFVGTLSHAFQ